MHLKQVYRDGVDVVLSTDELLSISNALNEVCHALDVPEFGTRIGIERDKALELLKAMQTAYDQVDSETVGRD
jgi:hypothetical protein